MRQRDLRSSDDRSRFYARLPNPAIAPACSSIENSHADISARL
jgi:hypothetical protein